MLLLWYLSLVVLGIGLHAAGLIFLLLALGDENDWLVQQLAQIGLTSVYKPVLTVGASNSFTLKKRSLDERLDTEKITFGGLRSTVTRYLRDPQNRLHRWGSVRFGFVDERTGLVFNPRDADAGREAKRHEEAGSLEYSGEPKNGRIPKFIRGVLDLPAGTRGVNLQDVHYLVGGSADSQAVDWLIDIYQRSQEPQESSLSVWQKLTPIAALALMLVLGSFLAGGGGGGGGGGMTLPVGGLLLLVASPSLPEWFTRTRAVTGVVSLLGVLVFLGLTSVFGPVLAIKSLVALAAGMLFLPFIAVFLGRSLGGLGVALGKLYFILAGFGYKNPVFHLTEDDEYELRELEDLPERSSEPAWYRFAYQWWGVTYENSEEAWTGKNVVLSPERVESMAQADVPVEGLDAGDAVANGLENAGHEAVIPKRPKSDHVHVVTRHVFGWFRGVGRGRLLWRALKQAKEDHFGGGQGKDDLILYTTIAFALLGLVVDIFIFF